MRYEVKQPILGLEEIANVELEKHDGLATLLKSENKDINLTLINAFVDENSFEIPAGLKVLLDINEDTHYSVYFTVIIHDDINESVINLGSPLIFNEDNKTMAQCTISDDSLQIHEL